MAKRKTTAKPRFYEVVFRGKPKVVRSFLSGLIIGSQRDATVYYSYLEGVHHEGKSEKLAEMVGLRGVDCHVIVDGETSDFLKSLRRRVTEETGLEITSNRFIRSASMEFRYHAYARRYEDDISALLDALPAGIRLEGFEHEVKLDPAARGVEAYSPVHHFESSGEGTLRGAVDALVEFKRTLHEVPLIETEDVVLNLA